MRTAFALIIYLFLTISVMGGGGGGGGDEPPPPVPGETQVTAVLHFYLLLAALSR